MPVEKGDTFFQRNFFIDYPYEEVMYRWDYAREKVFVTFYGETEKFKPIPHDNRLFNDALLSGDEITREQYENKMRK